jgi:uncharacterized protein with GYD domain
MHAVSGCGGLDRSGAGDDTAAGEGPDLANSHRLCAARTTEKEELAMSYLSASKLTFSPKWADMNEDERLAEQVAALDIVSKYGGEIKAQYVLWSDNCLFSVIDYADETSALKSELAIGRRGAFVLQQQRALPLEDVIAWQDEARTVAGK